MSVIWWNSYVLLQCILAIISSSSWVKMTRRRVKSFICYSLDKVAGICQASRNMIFRTSLAAVGRIGAHFFAVLVRAKKENFIEKRGEKVDIMKRGGSTRGLDMSTEENHRRKQCQVTCLSCFCLPWISKYAIDLLK